MHLALFPLPVVLFPGALLPLHIFEPRYRALLADCVRDDHRFGVLPLGEAGGPPAPGRVGCIALVRALQPLPDGRSNIVVSGEERFVLRHILPPERLYPVGEVDLLTDVPDGTELEPEAAGALRVLAGRYAVALAALSDVERLPEFSDDPGLLTFQCASLLDWDAAAKQQFLASRSARERATRLLETLPALLPDLEGRALVHHRASHNGSGPRTP